MSEAISTTGSTIFTDQELADSAATSAELLRSIARGWRTRLTVDGTGPRPISEAQRLVATLESAARLIETGEVEPYRTLEALRQSEERFRLMVESVQDYAIFMLDPEGRIVSWNRGAERIKGYRAEEIIGRHFSTFYSAEDRARGHPADELRLARERGSYGEEGWRFRKDGSQFWASVVITALTDARGVHVGFAKVTRDLTERQAADEQLRQSEERLRLLVESVKDYAIFMLDPDGRVATWNSGAQNIKQYAASEIIGKHFSVFYPPETAAAGHPARELEIATATGRYEEEGWRVRKDGERFWANVVLTAVHDGTGRLRGFAKVTRDLTERRRLEEEAHRAELLAAGERARAAEAESAVKLRDEFISVASHELRTPLSALLLKLQTLQQVLSSPAPATADPRLAKVGARVEGAVRQTQRLADLVERLLDVSRIVGGRLVLHPEEVDLAASVRHIVDEFQEEAQRSGSELRLHLGGPATGRWDRARVEQVITNIVSNAVKYGEKRPIDVAVDADQDAVHVSVQDRGIGIAPEDLDRIFDRFERAAPAQNYGGLGLGLYITRHLVEAHGGTIRVESQLGQGARFIIQLPRTAPAQRGGGSHPGKETAR